MGEWADDVIDAIMDDPGPYYGCNPRRYKVKIPTCKMCGKTNLIWQNVDNRWKLYELATTNIYDLQPHVCSIKSRFKRYA